MVDFRTCPVMEVSPTQGCPDRERCSSIVHMRA